MLQFTDGKLARYKRPSGAVFVDEIPRNPSGKALKRVLREQFPDHAHDPERAVSVVRADRAGYAEGRFGPARGSTSVTRAPPRERRRSPAAAVGGGDVGGDGEPEPGAAGVARAALVEADEALARRRARSRRAGCRARRRRRTTTPRRRRSRHDAHLAGGVAGGVGHQMVDGTAAPRRRRRPGRRVTDRDVDRHPPRRAAPTSRPRRRSRTSCVASPARRPGEQQQVVDEPLQPVELAEQHDARRVPVGRRVSGGRPPARCASRRSACAARARRRTPGGGSSSAPSRAGRASRSSSSPARRSRRPTPARAPARAASASRSPRPRDVTACTGRSARPASSQASPATSATSAGPTTHSRRFVVAIVSRTASSGDAVASVKPPAVDRGDGVVGDVAADAEHGWSGPSARDPA